MNLETKTYGVCINIKDKDRAEELISEILNNRKDQIEAWKKEWDLKEQEEKIKTMNYIFGKDETNQVFNELELRCASKIDLSDKKIVDVCKIIWDNKTRWSGTQTLITPKGRETFKLLCEGL